MREPWPGVRSLGWATDLMVCAIEGTQVREGPGFLVATTPQDPTFHWGNFLLFPEPPGPGDLQRWEALFAEHVGSLPGVKHKALGWDDPLGRPGASAEWTAQGYEVLDLVVLTADAVRPPPRLNPDIEVRPLTTDDHWARAADAHAVDEEPERGYPSYPAFMRAYIARQRREAEAGRTTRFGAFLRGAQVADLGMVVSGGVGRFQSVLTYLGHRRQGVCRSLVYHAARAALTELGASTLVIVARAPEAVVRVYEDVGFTVTERQRGASWWPRRADAPDPAGPQG